MEGIAVEAEIHRPVGIAHHGAVFRDTADEGYFTLVDGSHLSQVLFRQ
jgi:hypothetical protein